jgi:hypothetical protein
MSEEGKIHETTLQADQPVKHSIEDLVPPGFRVTP